MIWKIVAPAALFSLATGGIYYAAGSDLYSTDLTPDFYQDVNLLNRFENKKFIFSSSIETDPINVRSYLFNNSFSLLWKKPGDEKDKGLEANAFLLNILYPDWLTEYHPDRYSYVPKSYSGGDEIVMLLGTSFTFVKQLFDKVIDWKSEVNDKEEVNGLSLKDKSDKSSEHQFYFSHPWPTLENDDKIFQDRKIKETQDFLYRLDNNSPYYDNFDFGLNKSYYIKVNPENVSAIYAAVGLEVNSDLFNLGISNNRNLQNQLYRLHTKDINKVNWKSEATDIYGEKYKFGVDFAVIKVNLKINDVKKVFLDYLIGLHDKRMVLPQILKSYLDLEDGKTKSLYMGGWETLSDYEVEQHSMDNLFVKAELKANIASNKRPSECIDNKSNECIDLDIFDTYSDKTSSSKSSKSSKYEVIKEKYFANNEDGTLHVYYRIKNKSKNINSRKLYDVVYTGLKANSFNESLTNALKGWNDKIINKNIKLVDFFEAKPKVTSSWKEFDIKYSYFPFNDFNSYIFEKTAFRQTSEDLNFSSPANIFQVNGNKYLNIAHHLSVPNMNLASSKGSVVVGSHPVKNEKVLMGMFDGTSNWINPVFRNPRSVGKIMLFISPWRYDLFNEENRLSKPSLGDSLSKKKLSNRIIQKNRWYQKTVY